MGERVGELLEVIEERWFRVLVMLALQTGLRRSELLGLQSRDVDAEGCRLAVRRTVLEVEGEMRVEGTKSGKGRVAGVGAILCSGQRMGGRSGPTG